VIAVRSDLKVMVATRPIDFRCGINSLSALVFTVLNADPYAGDVWIFRSKRLDRLKILVWDGSGMVLVTKWLEEGRFHWPQITDGTVRISGSEMALLLDGLDKGCKATGETANNGGLICCICWRN
jgi:transposase